MTIKELTALPKVELHCHLDGSLSRGFIEKRLGRKVLQSELSVSEDCRSLNEYLEKFDLPGKCIMDETGLKEAGYDVLKSMKQENVCYAEIRFAPLLSETPDMNCNKVIEALLAGLEKGKRDFGVEYGVITCAMRHHSEEENACMLRTAREYLGHGVCAADLAGAESLYPMSEFMELFKKTKALGMPFTLHAGECGNVQNILDSVEAGAGNDVRDHAHRTQHLPADRPAIQKQRQNRAQRHMDERGQKAHRKRIAQGLEESRVAEHFRIVGKSNPFRRMLAVPLGKAGGNQDSRGQNEDQQEHNQRRRGEQQAVPPAVFANHTPASYSFGCFGFPGPRRVAPSRKRVKISCARTSARFRSASCRTPRPCRCRRPGRAFPSPVLRKRSRYPTCRRSSGR